MEWIPLTVIVALLFVLAYTYRLNQKRKEEHLDVVPGLKPASKMFHSKNAFIWTIVSIGDSAEFCQKAVQFCRIPQVHAKHVKYSESIQAPAFLNSSRIVRLDFRDGNFGDIAKAGSLHQFLRKLHKQFGPIASFWYGPTYTVSIANATLFKMHQHAYDRPVVLYKLFEDLFGPKSITYVNGSDGKSLRNAYDVVMTYDACKKYFPIFQEVADSIVTQWKLVPQDEHVPVSEYMSEYALKCVLIALFGETMADEKEIRLFRQLYDVAWGEMEKRLSSPTTPERQKMLEEATQKIYSTVSRLLESRKNHPPSHGDELFIDVLIESTDDEQKQINDAVTYVVAGFHTTGNVLTWALYFLATHPEYEDRLYREITAVLHDENVDHTNIGELVFVKQFLDETLRRGLIAPYASRCQDTDSILGGYTIPKHTPVIQALGVTLEDDKTWPNPARFDPDRFSTENSKRRPNLAFVPFGFAGKRVCPGQRFASQEAIVAMVTLVRQFKIHYVGSKNIEGVHGLVTHPSEEIWVTLQQR